jgi:FMN phosphatase YigB (HAD superfamily)
VRRFDLVVFDLGGVIIRLAAGWEDAHRLAGLSGEPPTDRAFRALLGDLARRADGSVRATEYYERVAAASGSRYAPDDVRRIGHVWLRGEYDGVGRVFDALDAAAVETAILSNTTEDHWSRLAPESGVAEFPTVLRARRRFASHLLGLVKPDPAIYRVVERETGHAAERILFFDDLEPNVEAARSVGWTSERIDPDGDPAAQMLDALRRHGVLGPE